MPVISPVVNREGLSKVEVKEAEGRKGPLLVVESVYYRGCCKNKGTITKVNVCFVLAVGLYSPANDSLEYEDHSLSSCCWTMSN